MARENLRLALEGRLASLEPAWPTKWENVKFDRNAYVGQSWQRSDLMVGQTRPLGITAGSGEEWSGVYQIMLFTPTQEGPAAAEARAKAIRGDAGSPGHFYRGLNLTSGGVTVTLLQPYDGAVQEDEHWWGFPVKIPFVVHVLPS